MSDRLQESLDVLGGDEYRLPADTARLVGDLFAWLEEATREIARLHEAVASLQRVLDSRTERFA